MDDFWNEDIMIAKSKISMRYYIIRGWIKINRNFVLMNCIMKVNERGFRTLQVEVTQLPLLFINLGIGIKDKTMAKCLPPHKNAKNSII